MKTRTAYIAVSAKDHVLLSLHTILCWWLGTPKL